MKLFKNDKINKDFFEKGFALIPLFNKQQTEFLLEFYKENVELDHKKEFNNGFHLTNNLFNYHKKKQINEFLTPIYEKELNNYLEDFKIAFSGFFVKEATEESEVPAHFDWTFVDEEKSFSFNAWVCLEDSNLKNGNMRFIVGSHKFQKTLRFTPWRPHYFNEYQEKMKNYFIDVPTKAGECIVFNHSIIHSSGKNYTSNSRISTVATCYSSDAELLYFHWDYDKPNNMVEKYLMTSDAFLRMGKDQKPNKEFFNEYVNYEIRELDFEQFKKKALKFIPITHIIKNRVKNLFEKNFK